MYVQEVVTKDVMTIVFFLLHYQTASHTLIGLKLTYFLHSFPDVPSLRRASPVGYHGNMPTIQVLPTL